MVLPGGTIRSWRYRIQSLMKIVPFEFSVMTVHNARWSQTPEFIKGRDQAMGLSKIKEEWRSKGWLSQEECHNQTTDSWQMLCPAFPTSRGYPALTDAHEKGSAGSRYFATAPSWFNTLRSWKFILGLEITFINHLSVLLLNEISQMNQVPT